MNKLFIIKNIDIYIIINNIYITVGCIKINILLPHINDLKILATEAIPEIPFKGGSMINIGIGVTIVEGNPEAARGFILNVPANLTLSIVDENETGPLINTPLSRVTPTEFGPLATIDLPPSNNKKI